MRTEIVVVLPQDDPPDEWDASVFLAGPSPRSSDVASWRPEAIRLLRDGWRSGRLVVFSPEPPGGAPDYDGQINWEERGLNQADVILFWVPRDLETLPGFTTNVEWGVWHDSGKVVYGAPPDAPKNRYLETYARKFGVPVAHSLAGAVDAVLEAVGAGAARSGGVREVPLAVWRSTGFQQWYAAHGAAGNALEGARVSGTLRRPGWWALRVRMGVGEEERSKDGELVVSRPDVASVVAYALPDGDRTQRDDVLVLLVREFRAAGRTADGFVHELPGGSGALEDPRAVACAELAEETGLEVAPERLTGHGSRQALATLSTHHAALFSVELTAEELQGLRAADGAAFGVAEDGERTTLALVTYGRLRRERLVDWGVLGMVAQVLDDRLTPA